MFQSYSFNSSQRLLPLLCPQVCSLCLYSISALQIGSPVPFSTFHIYVLIYNLFFSFWLTSLYITGFRFIHCSRTDSNPPFLWLSSIPLYVCTVTFIHASVDEHLGHSHVLPIINSAEMNTGVHCLLKLWFSLGICPIVGLLVHMVVLFLVFKEISILFCIVAVSIYITSNCATEFPFLHILPSIYCL